MGRGQNAIIQRDHAHTKARRQFAITAYAFCVACKHTRGKMVSMLAMKSDRLFKIFYWNNRQHWTKIIACHQIGAHRTIHNRKRTQPTCARAINHRGKTSPTTRHSLTRQVLTSLRGCMINQLKWLRTSDMRSQCFKKFSITPALHKHTPRRHARLPSVHGARHPNTFGGLDHVRVFKHKGGILTAQFQRG